MNPQMATIEAVLFASGDAVPVDRLCTAMGLSKQELQVQIQRLMQYYEKEHAGIRLICLEDKVQLCTHTDFADVIRTVTENRRAPSLSNAALEVLATVAYHQPVTRTFIEQLRGVDSSGTVHTLLEKGLIEEAGKLDVPGKPMQYRTSEAFLRAFQIDSLQALPPLPAMDMAEDGQIQLEALQEQQP